MSHDPPSFFRTCVCWSHDHLICSGLVCCRSFQSRHLDSDAAQPAGEWLGDPLCTFWSDHTEVLVPRSEWLINPTETFYRSRFLTGAATAKCKFGVQVFFSFFRLLEIPITKIKNNLFSKIKKLILLLLSEEEVEEEFIQANSWFPVQTVERSRPLTGLLYSSMSSCSAGLTTRTKWKQTKTRQQKHAEH